LQLLDEANGAKPRNGTRQIRFIETLVDQLTHNGIVEAGALYASPFLRPEQRWPGNSPGHHRLGSLHWGLERGEAGKKLIRKRDASMAARTRSSERWGYL